MKHLSKLWLATVMLATPAAALAESYLISTPHTSMLLEGSPGQTLRFLYYGSKVENTEVEAIKASNTLPWADAYPAFGYGYDPDPALTLRQPDGQMALQMVMEKAETRTETDSRTTTFTLKDKLLPIYVKLHYKAYTDVDVIEMWTEISHTLKRPVTLEQYASAYLPLRATEAWISHLHGSWGNEGILHEEKLDNGVKTILNRDGMRNSHISHAEVMLSLDGQPQENTGRVVGAALCWGGNYALRVNKQWSNRFDLMAGIDPMGSAYTLQPKEVFTTPELAVTYSHEGLGGASRNLHRWARATHLGHNGRLRDILLNSWEGVYLNVDEQKMHGMIQDIASLGGELFVMDDGWFGRKYKRSKDNAALGDWMVDTDKLPHGIEGLIAEAKRNGIKFGIWIEPEMTNSKSELFEKHPDWVLRPEGRDYDFGRGGTQLLLDLSNPEVQDFVFGVVDNLKTNYPELAYIKWDANMSLSAYGSPYLSKDRQSHLYIEYMRGLEKVLQRIQAKYPDLVMQACASGGGRANYGILPYYDEFWVSDNTDALQRIYMQWGHSYFFPACAMASHVSAAPNHQTGRRIPIRFRFAVAMSARLGMEIQPKNMTEQELAFSKHAIADYKTIRPLVQTADLYRLISPYDRKGVSSLMYVAPDKRQAVFFCYKLEHFVAQEIPDFRMNGLDPDAHYRVTEINLTEKDKPADASGKVFSGRFLMEQGLYLPMGSDYSCHVLKLEQVN